MKYDCLPFKKNLAWSVIAATDKERGGKSNFRKKKRFNRRAEPSYSPRMVCMDGKLSSTNIFSVRQRSRGRRKRKMLDLRADPSYSPVMVRMYEILSNNKIFLVMAVTLQKRSHLKRSYLGVYFFHQWTGQAA